MASCPHLTLLVTSREPLHLAGEHEYAVDPLAPAEAVELFLTRALAAKRDFVANGEVAAICERLDHLPLAIELAAARVKVLSPAALLQRLEQRLPLLAGGARDLPERQRTLRATIEWSHELLTGDEQRLFARLAVFRGGATLEAAEAVADADVDTLQSLVDKSLVRVRDSARFWMLETIREFALERLDTSGEADQLRGRHAEYFLEMAEKAEPHIHDPDKVWVDRIESEHANMDGALDWFTDADKLQEAQRLAGALGEFWLERNHFVEARRRIEGAVAGDARPTKARAVALTAAASAATANGDAEAGRAFADEALTIYRTLGDVHGMAMAEWHLGYAHAELDDWQAANRLLRDSVSHFEATHDRHATMWATRTLAFTHDGLGETDQARRLHEENLARARALGNEEIEATTLGALAMIFVGQEQAATALAMLQQSTTIFRRLNDRWRLAVSVCRLADAFARTGRAAIAAQLISSFEVLRQELGANVPWVAKMNNGTLDLVRAELDASEFAEAWRRGAGISLDDAVELALGATGSARS
jgi:predicted ATPase